MVINLYLDIFLFLCTLYLSCPSEVTLISNCMFIIQLSSSYHLYIFTSAISHNDFVQNMHNIKDIESNSKGIYT